MLVIFAQKSVNYLSEETRKGAILIRRSMPGSANKPQVQKNGVQPMLSTMTPVAALQKVRGTAESEVKSANCVAV